MKWLKSESGLEATHQDEKAKRVLITFDQNLLHLFESQGKII